MRHIDELGMILVAVNLFVGCTWACSVDGSWRRYSLEKRLYLADLVVVGTDIRHFNRNSTDRYRIVDSEFNVSCILKGDEQVINETIIIGAIEPRNSCTETETNVGVMYIVGLARSANNMYRWHEVGVMQPAAVPYTNDNLRKALTVCGLQNPIPPSNVKSARENIASCPDFNPGFSCTTGTVYTTAQKAILGIACVVMVYILLGVVALLWVARFIRRKSTQSSSLVKLSYTNKIAITDNDKDSNIRSGSDG